MTRVTCMTMFGLVLLAMLGCIGPVSGCSSDKDCFKDTIVMANASFVDRALPYVNEFCCKYIHPPKCMKIEEEFTRCFIWTTPPQTWTRPQAFIPKPYYPPNHPGDSIIPTIDYNPTDSSYDDSNYGSSSSSSTSSLVIALVVLFVITIKLAICYRYCCRSRRSAQQVSQGFIITSQSDTGQRETRNQPSHRHVLIVVDRTTTATVPQSMPPSIYDKLPSYEDVCNPALSSVVAPPPQYDQLSDEEPLLPRYEETTPPRYEDAANNVV